MHSSSSPNSLISDLLLSFHITKSHLSSSKKLLHGCCITQMFGVRCAALVDYLQRRARSLVHTLVIRHETRPSSITPKPHQPPSILYDNHRLNSFILKQESWFILSIWNTAVNTQILKNDCVASWKYFSETLLHRSDWCLWPFAHVLGLSESKGRRERHEVSICFGCPAHGKLTPADFARLEASQRTLKSRHPPLQHPGKRTINPACWLVAIPMLTKCLG